MVDGEAGTEKVRRQRGFDRRWRWADGNPLAVARRSAEGAGLRIKAMARVIRCHPPAAPSTMPRGWLSRPPPPKRGLSFDMQDRTGCEPPVRELAIQGVLGQPGHATTPG